MVVIEITLTLRGAMLFEVLRGCAEHQALSAEILMAKICRPNISATNAHDDINAFVYRIDEAISERDVGLKHGVKVHKVHDQGKNV
ncbi:hypothetical protein D3C77_617170 [compost metagenome]